MKIKKEVKVFKENEVITPNAVSACCCCCISIGKKAVPDSKAEE